MVRVNQVLIGRIEQVALDREDIVLAAAIACRESWPKKALILRVN